MDLILLISYTEAFKIQNMNARESNFISAVIYVHNAESQIGAFLQMIMNMLETNFEYSEIICVNDHSDDGSVSIIREMAERAASTSLSIVNLSYYHGMELAMNAGVDLSIGDFVMEFDHPVPDFDSAVVMKIYHHALDGYDIVSASSSEKEHITSRIFYWLYDRFSDVPGRMRTESFRILSRRAINRIQSMNKTVPYRKAVYSQCGLRTDNLQYEALAVAAAKSHSRDSKFRMNLAVDSLILFTKVGYDFSKFMTVFMMLLSVFMICYTIVIYLTSQPVAGWTTTILFLSVAFFGLFGILTIVVKYLQLLVDLVFRRQHYSFESVEKLTS